ncbi:MAG: glutamine-hydrolyzing carbamoyl-phosphate synthase small subunit [Phycisphaeraceae bacterium]
MTTPQSSDKRIAKLALEDGTVFTGTAFGAVDHPEPVAGEVVFNTGMTGYQEILTDPSYAGQIVTMTYPHIGNYGINEEDIESKKVQVAGFVVRELASHPSNYRATNRLERWLAEQGVLGIAGIDTRALTRKLRIDGAMRGILSAIELDNRKLVDLARESAEMAGQNLARLVSPTKNSKWAEKLGDRQWPQHQAPPSKKPLRVVAIDCGAKSNILRHLADQGCEVTVVPHDASAKQILDLKPDGLFVSNGPGDPSAVAETIANLREVNGRVPTFGICLGHQMLALSLGAETFKLKFGHRGCNQPVQNLATGKVEITSQNHGFAVDQASLEKVGAVATHINLNDQTLEGFRHTELPIFAVQYHPEASPGPHDAAYLFDCFMDMMRSGACPTAEQMDAAQRRRATVTQ